MSEEQEPAYCNWCGVPHAGKCLRMTAAKAAEAHAESSMKLYEARKKCGYE